MNTWTMIAKEINDHKTTPSSRGHTITSNQTTSNCKYTNSTLNLMFNFSENDLYDEPNPSSMAEHPASGQRKSRINTNYPSGGEGRPNKISQYKVKQTNISGSGADKKNIGGDYGSSDRRRQKYVDNDNEVYQARNMSMDDSFGSPRNQSKQPNDYEIKQSV